MTHQEIEENEIIERYVLHQLEPEDRLAFQEHYFGCDECFERAQMEARFIASVRRSSTSGVIAAAEPGQRPGLARLTVPGRRWATRWFAPAFAASLLLALSLIVVWALSLRHSNQLLAKQVAEQSGAAERLRLLEDKVRELESEAASQQQKDSLKEEIEHLKEQLADADRRQKGVAQLEINVPVINIYPTGDQQRSGGNDEINRIRVPRGTRNVVLILGYYKPGSSEYRLEIIDSTGRPVAKRVGLKPDSSGELSVMLNPASLRQGKSKLTLYLGSQQIAEYVILFE